MVRSPPRREHGRQRVENVAHVLDVIAIAGPADAPDEPEISGHLDPC
jgi:hypothetical protein